MNKRINDDNNVWILMMMMINEVMAKYGVMM